MRRPHELVVHTSTPLTQLLAEVATQRVALIAVAGAPELLAATQVTDLLSSLRWHPFACKI